MENKINIAELLKDCPTGMELDCTMYENVEFDYIEQSPESAYPIHCLMKTNGGYTALVFTYNGCNDRHPNAKCVIFPKGKTTWEGFQRPFKDGDIVFSGVNLISIFKCIKDGYSGSLHSYVSVAGGAFEIDKDWWTLENIRFATEEEKGKLFKVLKDNGYEWNEETKNLKKLPKDKFDINTLVPFESKVLVRDSNRSVWNPSFWGGYTVEEDYYRYNTVRGIYAQCIPYEGNEHLLGKSDDCNDFYKIWE